MTESELRAILSTNIKRYRNAYNLSQAELSEKLDISINFLSNIESGKKWVSPATLVKFANTFNVAPYELFRPEEALPPSTVDVLSKFSDEVIIALGETVKNIQNYYVSEGKEE
ncbi:helix-turn-helix domain-containing protein [Breznakiella homolactica]|uniref:Helix-turn-helix transcriptional regulator n=1 Tax=Breznakiella homolactica TaxID=2798577 RepID=A0A7T8BBV3_9SPIR|nr:helix-turn-helix transcriptional regulator [Breznakiella homolactica]QQO09588.1 helix-turn-helix domain-containing protein [Breznakiella homolactica]